jgi:hypothetical protein
MPKNMLSKKTFYLVLLALSFSFLGFLLKEANKEITGYASSYDALGVSIDSNTKIRVTVFDYDTYVLFGNTTQMTFEVQNSGSTGYDERIEVYIKNSTLDNLAYYYDAQTYLGPGDRESFQLIYLPPELGVYYIQLRVPYAETKRLEMWGVFVVYEEPPPGPTTTTIPDSEEGVIVTGAYGDYAVATRDYIQGEKAPSKRPFLLDALRIYAPEMIDVPIGKTTISHVKVENIGNSTLHSFRVITYSESIDVDFFPKVLPSLPPNTSSVFMFTIKPPPGVEPNIYSLGLEFTSNEYTVVKKILLNVTDVNLKDLVYQMILNYKYIIAEIEDQINQASENGYKVSRLVTMLEGIKVDLRTAEDYYNKANYITAYEKLQEIREDIQKLLLELALLLIPREVFLSGWRLLIPIAFLLLLLIILLIYLIKKSKEKEKRPKLLREMEELEENKT